MADKQAIMELLNKGGWAYDKPDIDFLANMFTTDGSFDISIGTMGNVMSLKSRAEIRKLYEDSLASQSDQRRHIITNMFFENETDLGATATSYLSLVAIKDGVLSYISTGIYTDTVIKDEGSWRIKHRDLYLDLPF